MTEQDRELFLKVTEPMVKKAINTAYDQAIDDAIKIVKANGLYTDTLIEALLMMKSNGTTDRTDRNF
jgi:hypothetical protein